MGFMIETLEGCTVWRVPFSELLLLYGCLFARRPEGDQGLRFIVVSRSWEAAALMGGVRGSRVLLLAAGRGVLVRKYVYTRI